MDDCSGKIWCRHQYRGENPVSHGVSSNELTMVGIVDGLVALETYGATSVLYLMVSPPN